MRRVSKERIAAMAALYREGKTLADVGAAFGISRQRVQQLFDDHDIPRYAPGRTRILTPEQEAGLLQCYRDGATMQEAGDAYGVSNSVVQRILREADEPACRSYRIYPWQPDATEKHCTRCHTLKPLDMFPKVSHTLDGRQSHCKACYAAKTREWTAKHRKPKGV
jgi:hypothetical protein